MIEAKLSRQRSVRDKDRDRNRDGVKDGNRDGDIPNDLDRDRVGDGDRGIPTACKTVYNYERDKPFGIER